MPHDILSTLDDILSTLQILTYLVLSFEVNNIIILILQMRKLR